MTYDNISTVKDETDDGRLRASGAAGAFGGAAAVWIDGHIDGRHVTVRRKRLRGGREKRLEPVRRKDRALVVLNLAENLALVHGLVGTVQALGLALTALGLPVRPILANVVTVRLFAVGHTLGARCKATHHIEDGHAAVVDGRRQLAVEVPAALRRRDHNDGRLADLQARNDDLVPDVQVHVGCLFAVDDVGAHAAQLIGLCKSKKRGV